ncbi:MAG: hypothetical protein RIR33_1165 [Pseudomonadota bacterium]|jgi:prepilin-type N-terminal cleavage/methylation domain-containing protein
MMDKDAGFTLTELIAGLLVASLLIAGVVDIIRQYALTTQRVRVASVALRSHALVEGLMAQLARADPESLVVRDTEVRATIGTVPVSATLSRGPGATTFAWSGPGVARAITLPASVRFENPRPGVVTLAQTDAPPIATVRTRRTQVYDCQFDTVSLTCRQ